MFRRSCCILRRSHPFKKKPKNNSTKSIATVHHFLPSPPTKKVDASMNVWQHTSKTSPSRRLLENKHHQVIQLVTLFIPNLEDHPSYIPIIRIPYYRWDEFIPNVKINITKWFKLVTICIPLEVTIHQPLNLEVHGTLSYWSSPSRLRGNRFHRNPGHDQIRCEGVFGTPKGRAV